MVFQNSKQRLPKLYKEASKALQKIKEEGGSVKTVVYEARHPNLKALYALVLETLRHGDQLDYLIRKSQILVKNPRLNPWVARILMTELIWQKKALSPVSPPQEIVLSFKEEFLSELANIPKDEGNLDSSSSASAERQVRYVRVNTLKDTVENVIEWFVSSGWEQIGQNATNKKSFIDSAQNLGQNQFMRDPHIPNLLVFPRDFKFYETELYTESVILLQDKASCVPPVLLNPPPGSVILDMCAAPGMKTTQIAALINNKGKVNAVEINQRRFNTLCETVEKSGSTCVKTINGDVLRHSNDMPDVDYILLDPPCSGSGMLDRKGIFGEDGKKDDIRLAKLANFQCSLLRHAMTNFPNVKRIVYSTCSIHPEENEAVVDSVLKSIPQNFTPLRDPPFTDWMARGSADYEFGPCGFYAHPSTHLTNGFFVIVFDRSENDYMTSQSSQPLEKQKEEPKKKKRKMKPPKEDGEKSEKASLPDDGVLKLMRAMQKPQVDASQPEEAKKTKKKGKVEGEVVQDDGASQPEETKKKKNKRKVEGDDVEGEAVEEDSSTGKRSRKHSLPSGHDSGVANGKKKKKKEWKVSEKC